MPEIELSGEDRKWYSRWINLLASETCEVAGNVFQSKDNQTRVLRVVVSDEGTFRAGIRGTPTKIGGVD